MPTKALIPLPQDTNPPNTRCVTVELPEDPEWLGMFWGALDQLTRWNSYQRDPGHNGLAIASAWRAIIDAARASECPAACPGFYAQRNDANCPVADGFVNIQVIPDCDNCDFHNLHSYSPLNLLAGVGRVGYQFLQEADDTPCGGHVCAVSGFVTAPYTSATWTLQWRDCLDVDHEEIQIASTFYFADFTAKWLCLSATANISVVVSYDGPPLCLPA